MTVPNLKVKKNFVDAKLPVRANPHDSGLDVFVYKFVKVFHGESEFHVSEDGVTTFREDVTHFDLLNNESKRFILNPGERILIDTGISVAVPEGFEVQVRSRSGLTLNEGLVVANGIGTVDSSYRGPLCVIILNVSFSERLLYFGQKIAQIVVSPVILSEVVEAPILDDTDRGSNGFGSSGKT